MELMTSAMQPAFIQAFVGDYAFYIIGFLLIVGGIGWLRRPFIKLMKAGLRSIFSSDSAPTDTTP
jgi:hypothetical protein